MKQVKLNIGGEIVTFNRVEGGRRKPDPAEEATEKALKALDSKLRNVYQTAADDLFMKQQSWIDAHQKRAEKYQKQVEAGLITQQDYDAWMQGQLFQEKAWALKRGQLARTMAEADKRAMEMINEGKLEVFAENANYMIFGVEQNTGATAAFGLYDQKAVLRLVKDEPNLLPMPEIDEEKDYAWYNRIIGNAVTQGIIQGESLDKICLRVAEESGERGLNALRRNARTAYTGAQNAGRVEGMKRARDELGIHVKKRWMSTLDDKTRDSHQELDGKTAEIDEPFDSLLGPIMYPGDPDAEPGNVYNCRCTLTYVYPKYNTAAVKRNDGETGENVGAVTYTEWKEQKAKTEQPTTEYLQDKARFDELRGKYSDATSAMLFGTPEDAADFVRTQKSVYEYAVSRGDFKTAYESQPITEQTLESWRTQPTQEQKDAIKTYSRNGYKGMNDYLRNGGSLQGVEKREIDALQSYLTENSTKRDMFLKRGISVKSLDKMFGKGWQDNMGDLKGVSVTDKGFMSTSPFSSGNFGKNAVMYIKAPEGTQGAYIADIVGGEKKTEGEFLLPHDTTVSITRAYTSVNKYGDTIPVVEAVIKRRR